MLSQPGSAPDRDPGAPKLPAVTSETIGGAAPAGRRQRLLAAYDGQRRAGLSMRLPEGAHEQLDGPLYRSWGWAERGLVLHRDLSALDGPALERLIQRQVRFFSSLGLAFEWKTFGHDRSADLPGRLLAAGFLPEAEESLMVGELDQLETAHRLPPGLRLRRARSRADCRLAALVLAQVWEVGLEQIADFFHRDLEANPEDVCLLLVEAAQGPVAVARANLSPGSDFASLWSGTTVPEWRGRGLYRALVARRAELARRRGFRYLQVDASELSRPILERLGFLAVSTTTPYVWSPERGQR